MVDTCIEIPQLGIIRSLNVHVSGSLLIWEYISFMVFSLWIVPSSVCTRNRTVLVWIIKIQQLFCFKKKTKSTLLLGSPFRQT